MKNLLKVFAMTGMAVFIMSCSNQAAEQKEETKQETKPEVELLGSVLTADDQGNMTPDDVLASLEEGNMRYMENDLTPRDLPQQVGNAVGGQFPKAVVLSCIDSRVPVEYVFDAGVGDMFVARVAGNFVNEDILGSMEYGCAVAGSKLIVVLGHESCGAVKAAIDEVEMGNITAMLSKIHPAVEASQDFEGEKTSKNAEFVTHVCTNNVNLTMEDIRERSPILKDLEEKGDIRIVGAVYDMESGKVRFL